PGVVLRRPVGSAGPFREHADLPTDLAGDGPKHRPKKTLAKPKEHYRGRPTTRQPAKPHLHSRESSDGGKTTAGRERPPGRGRASDATRQLPRHKQRWKRVKGVIVREWRQSRPRATPSKGRRKQRTPVGRKRRTNWRVLYAMRDNRVQHACVLFGKR